MEKTENLNQFTATILATLPATFEVLTISTDSGPVIVRNKETGDTFKIELSTYSENTPLAELAPILLTNETTGITYELSATTIEQTAIRIFKLKNLSSGIEINFFEGNEEVDIASVIAWIGARTSREPKTYVDIANSLVDKNVDAKAKLGNVFANYKHDSPAGMAYLTFGIDNISISDAFALFYRLAVGDGQELSTRYVEFIIEGVLLDQAIVDELGEEYREEVLGMMANIQDLEVSNYRTWLEKLEASYRKYLEAEYQAASDRGDDLTDVKITDKMVNNRSLDIARNFIPIGAKTKFYLAASARMWRDLIIRLRESDDISQRNLAEDIAMMFTIGSREETADLAPQMVSEKLISHSEGKSTISEAVSELDNFLNTHLLFQRLLSETDSQDQQGNRTEVELIELGRHAPAFYYIMGIYPNLNAQKLLKFLETISKEDRRKIGNIIFGKHGRFDQMSNKADIRSHLTIIIKSAITYLRDYNRHRSAGRFLTLFETTDIDLLLADGFNQNFQINTSDFLKQYAEAWDESFKEIYARLRELNNKLKEEGVDKDVRRQIIINMLPMGHQATMFMTIPAMQIPYILTTRGAGKDTADRDFGYVQITQQIIEALRESDDYNTDLFVDMEPIDIQNLTDIARRG